MIREMWNSKFSREGYLYGIDPNVYLAGQIDGLSTGATLLLLGEGEGRNACYAASKGLKVTALDASDVGLEKALQLADVRGVSIDTVHTDLEQWHADTPYDAVMASFLHLSEPLRTQVFREALRALRPSGIFAAEFFSVKQLPLSSGGPKDAELLYTLDSLEAIFDIPGFELLQLEEVVDTLEEGKGHSGEAQLIRVKVKKI
jgi:cyclopropane fatty-acyl-phospholipid synthase-like methyltransferase